jgi:hypothetical protein
MRYTKIALLTFGAGLIAGLVVVVGEMDRLDRVASGLMALGLAALPLGMLADWRLATKAVPKPTTKRRARTTTRRVTAGPAQKIPADRPRHAPRRRKPARPKR